MYARAFLIPAFIAVLLLQPPAEGYAATLTQMKAQVYVMGVNYGIASYLGSALACCADKRTQAMEQALESTLGNVDKELVQIAAADEFHVGESDRTKNLTPAFFLFASMVRTLLSDYEILRSADYRQLLNGDHKTVGDVYGNLYQGLVDGRDRITTLLAKFSQPATSAYVLGINMGIAEGHATQDNSVRAVVYASLNNAKTAAQQLKLDTSQLDQCMAIVLTSTPMTEIYQKILSIRSTYQALLSQ